MKEGDLLSLVREPDSTYDSCAVALHWHGKKIGFEPSSINEMLNYLLDADALSLFGVITRLEKEVKPWENVSFAVYFVQEVNKDLPAHASYLTLIEAPHYRTLRNKKQEKLTIHDVAGDVTMEELFDCDNRILDLDKIPEHHKEIREYYEKIIPTRFFTTGRVDMYW